MDKRKYSIIFFGFLILSSSIFNPTYSEEKQCATVNFCLVNIYPHDPKAFTQGLIYHQGVLYESTGLRGRSSLRKVALTTGEVLQIKELDKKYFGEGLTLWQEQLIQLTWRSNQGFVYQRENFEVLETFSYPTEGWGLTHDGKQLIMSDGTDKLYFLEPTTFKRLGSIAVFFMTDDKKKQPVKYLNELEYIKNEIWANIWYQDVIARISPQTGEILGWLDLAPLRTIAKIPKKNVLNGIAYDKSQKRIFVTGKLWPKLFEIQVR